MNKRDWIIAGPVIAALAGCAAAFLHGVQIENSFDGIVALRAVETPSGGRVAVVAAHALHVLDSDGKRLSRQDLGAIGLQDSPNDIDLTVDEHGRMEAWFFEDVGPQPRVMRCAWNEERKAMEACAAAARGPQLKWNPRSRAVHIAVDRAGHRMFIADAESARVQVFDFSGKRIAVSDPSVLPLRFPNRLRYLGRNRLAVADNDDHRILWTEVRPGSAPRLMSALYASDHPQARWNRTKVTDAAFAQSGGIWMLAVKQGQKDGDVLVFDGSRHPVRRAELPDGADPLIVEALGDTAIVADYSLVMLYRLDRAGHYLGEFGDAALRAELTPMRELSVRSARWTTGSMVAGAFVIVAGLVLAWRFGYTPSPSTRMQAQAAALAAFAEPVQFPVVLDQTAAYRAALRKQAWSLGAAAVISLGAAIAMAVIGLGGPRSSSLLVQIAFLTVMSPIMFWYLARELLQTTQLRVTASRAGLFRGGKCIAEAPLAEIYASDRMLLLGRTRIAYRTAARRASVPPKYDVELLGRALILRLPPDHLLSDVALSKKVLERQPLWLRVLAVAGAIGALVWIFKDLLPI